MFKPFVKEAIRHQMDDNCNCMEISYLLNTLINDDGTETELSTAAYIFEEAVTEMKRANSNLFSVKMITLSNLNTPNNEMKKRINIVNKLK